MAAVRTRSQRVLHRVAVAAVIAITLIFLPQGILGRPEVEKV